MCLCSYSLAFSVYPTWLLTQPVIAFWSNLGTQACLCGNYLPCMFVLRRHGNTHSDVFLALGWCEPMMWGQINAVSTCNSTWIESVSTPAHTGRSGRGMWVLWPMYSRTYLPTHRTGTTPGLYCAKTVAGCVCKRTLGMLLIDETPLYGWWCVRGLCQYPRWSTHQCTPTVL